MVWVAHRIPTHFTILLRKFRETSPNVLLDVLLVFREASIDLLVCHDSLFTGGLAGKIEMEHGTKEEAHWPTPFWALVVVATSGCLEIV